MKQLGNRPQARFWFLTELVPRRIELRTSCAIEVYSS